MASFNEFRYQMLESARSQLQFAPSKAVETLFDLMENSLSDETRRKAAMDVLRMAGFEAGRHEPYGWGIGSTSEEYLRHEMDGTLSIHNMLSI